MIFLLLLVSPPDASALRIRSTAAFAPCVASAADAFTRESGTTYRFDVGLPDPPQGADVVVGDDSEMTRLLEGGGAVLSTSVDLGAVPWVYVSPKGVPWSASSAEGPVTVLAGPAGREARTLLSMSRAQMEVGADPAALRRAPRALLPLSLAGPGEHRPAPLPPLQATAAAIAASRNAGAASRFLAFLRTRSGQAALAGCFRPAPAASTAAPVSLDAYGRAVVDWWLPQCSLERNGHNDPQQSVGPPNAVRIEPDRYQGLVSLGQGGYVVLELGETAVDGPGADLRVYQTTSNEPVTLYASASPAGPFTLVGLRRTCGVRSAGIFSNHCDFDLRDAGLASARYVKVEDGEIYPCLAGGTRTEGSDLDAVETLNR
jgi:hypothetical protein